MGNNNKALGNTLDLMDSFLEDIRAEKQASDPSKPTTHPVMGADDGTQPAKEGTRSAENEKDVRKNLGESGITGQEDANSAPDNSTKLNIGTTKMDAEAVKGNVQEPKAKKDGPAEKGRGDASPGHPSNETFNEKYSSIRNLGNSILSKVAQATNTPPATKQAAAATAASENAGKEKEVTVPAAKGATDPGQTPTQVDAEKRAAAEAYPKEAQFGYDQAKNLAVTMGLIKDASAEETEAALDSKLQSIIKTAQDDAAAAVDLVRGFREGQNLALRKQANLRKAAEGEEGAPPGGAGEGLPPELMGDEGGGQGDPGAGDPEGGGGGGDDAQILQAVAAALEEAGVSPEELAEALASAEGGGGQGDDGGMGGMSGGMGGGAGAPPPGMGGPGGGGPPQGM